MKKNAKYKTTEEIKEILLNEGLSEIVNAKYFGIFGSYARKEDFQDIDILIDYPVDILKLYELKILLNKKYKLKFDFMIKEYADPIILRNAMKDIIYVKFS